MATFAQNLISRHAQTGDLVQPRVRGRFEPTSPADATPFGTGDEPGRAVPESPVFTPQNRQADYSFPVAPETDQRTRIQNAIDVENLRTAGQKPLISPPVFGPPAVPGQRQTQQAVWPVLPGQPISGNESAGGLAQPARANPFVADPATRTQPTGPFQAHLATAEPMFGQKNGIGIYAGDSLPGIDRLRTMADEPASLRRADALPQPAIQVTIGRIEVRAIMPTPMAKPAPTPGPKPRLSLEDYLKQRDKKM